MGIISSASLWTELIPILSEGGKGDTTCKTGIQNRLTSQKYEIFVELWKKKKNLLALTLTKE